MYKNSSRNTRPKSTGRTRRKARGKNNKQTRKKRFLKKNHPSKFVKYGIIPLRLYNEMVKSGRYVFHEPKESRIIRETDKERRQNLKRIIRAMKMNFPMIMRMTHRCFKKPDTLPSYPDGGGYGCDVIVFGRPIRFSNRSQFNSVKKQLGVSTLGIAYSINSGFENIVHVYYG